MSHDSPLLRIADDLYQVQIPLPFALNIVNCYLLHGKQGWTIIDTGINTPAGRAVWMHVFEVLRITPAELQQIVLTHVHPDHFGLAGWLQGLAHDHGRQVPVYTSQREIEQARLLWYGDDDYDFGRWLREGGMPDLMAQQVADSMDDTRFMTLPLPAALQPLEAGCPVQLGERSFETILAPGHSDGQILFYDRADKLLLSGDHVLMKITPNIGMWTHSDSDPLGRFTASLGELRGLDIRLALPGHKRLIEDWRGRIDELLGHHEHRLELTLGAVRQDLHTPYEVSGRIFDTSRFTVHEWRFALAETLAHLEYLRVRGHIVRQDDIHHYESI